MERPAGISEGYCWCGCGKKTNIATRPFQRLGYKKGDSFRFFGRHAFKPKTTGKILKNYIGRRYGRLLVISMKRENQITYSVCKCDCGMITTVRQKDLGRGDTKSCGCWQSDRIATMSFKHGDCAGSSQSPEWKTWSGMLDRCENPRASGYRYYGERGITVCERWHEFINFLQDMGRKPNRNLTIERIDNEKGYFPENCRWATKKEQVNNRRGVRLYEFIGVKLTISQWADLLNLKYATLKTRLRAGWPIEEVLSVPIGHKRTMLPRKEQLL